jgi:uncharacterized protein (TIGR02596 family)
MNPPASPARAFSLVELLTVLAIIAVIAVLATPALTQTLRAHQLTTTGQQVVDQLNLARQTAQSRNAPVEVRYYKLPAFREAATAAPAVYRAMQSFLVQESGATPIGKPLFFPSPVLVSPNLSESAFLFSTNHPEQTPAADSPLPGYGANYRYRAFRYSPNGSASVLNSENFVTLVLERDKNLGEGANFFTVQVAPMSGGVRSYRP